MVATDAVSGLRISTGAACARCGFRCWAGGRIVIDVFWHSPDYYAVPVLYPFSYRSFDGIAWIPP